MQSGESTMKKITGHAPTDAWLAKQPIWHDSDMIKMALVVSLLAGSIGILIGYFWALPDLSGLGWHYLKG
jgi:hypothetical protein